MSNKREFGSRLEEAHEADRRWLWIVGAFTLALVFKFLGSMGAL